MRRGLTIIGTGMWGTTLAIITARHGLSVTLWARSAEEATALQNERENKVYLPGVPFPEGLRITASLPEALSRCHLLLLVVPAQRMRQNVALLAPHLRPDIILVSATKGLELETGKRMSEVIREELPSSLGENLCVLSGPNLAREIAAGLPASSVVASEKESLAQAVQRELMMPTLRLYTNTDLVGVELTGALKNIIALGAGMCDGLGYGDNAKAAFLTRGLAEIARLGVAMGANPLTFSGLAGLGDLVATCASPYSRNRYVGEQLAKGRKLEEIRAAMLSVAEGIDTTPAALRLAAKYGVEMPITEQTYYVLFEGKAPAVAVRELMLRSGKAELAGLEGRKT